MGPRRRFLIHTPAVYVVLGMVSAAGRQQSQPATQPATTTQPTRAELPEQVSRLLADVKDFSFNYDYPGYFALLRHMKSTRRSPGHAREPTRIDDWHVLLERPSDFRGEPITIEGIIGRNKDPYRLTKYRELGLLWQVELRRRDQPLSCTVIFTNDVADLPIGGWLELTGYFLMVHNYKSRTQKTYQSAVIVALGPTAVSEFVPKEWRSDRKPPWMWIMGAVVFGLLLVVFLLRRSAAGRGRRGRTDLRTLRAAHSAPANLSEDLAEWAEEGRRGSGDYASSDLDSTDDRPRTGSRG